MPLQIFDMKVVLMPRLRLLTQLDPDGLYEFNASQTLLFVSLFDSKVHVTKGYVGATVSERKPCKKVGGLLAGGRGVSSRKGKKTRR